MKIFIKLLLIVFCKISLVSCLGLSPLYNNNDANLQKEVMNINVLPVGGRHGVLLKNELIKNLGSNIANNYQYILKTELTISSVQAQAFNSDGTASRFKTSINVNYDLYDNNNCIILSQNNSTDASYNSKSSGYDFGNISSKSAAISRNIEYNVKLFYPQIYNAIKNKHVAQKKCDEIRLSKEAKESRNLLKEILQEEKDLILKENLLNEMKLSKEAEESRNLLKEIIKSKQE